MQKRLYSVGDPNTAQIHNNKSRDVISPGVYLGFKPQASATNVDSIDFISGNDGANVLVTTEGLTVTETADVTVAVTVSISSGFYRWDLVVFEYQFVDDRTIEGTYKIIAGNPTSTATPVKPIAQNPYQIPLCYVYQDDAVSTLDQTMLMPVETQKWVLGRDITSLKPTIDPTDSGRIYVYPGVFPNQEATSLVDFTGGYSTAIDTTGLSTTGDLKYVLFGVSDSGVVIAVASSTTDPNIITTSGVDAILVCIATFTNVGGTILIDSIKDIRFPYVRAKTETVEISAYTNQLANSVFKYLSLDTFATSEMIDLTTEFTTPPSPATSQYDVEIEGGFTRLKITPNVAYPSLTDDFEVPTVDLIARFPTGTIPSLNFAMAMVDADAAVTVDYSGNTATAGYTDLDHELNKVMSTKGISQFYLKLKIPVSEFINADGTGYESRYIYSYGVYMVQTEEVVNSFALDNYRLNGLLQGKVNLIDNPFTSWNATSYALASTSEEISNDQSILGPPGWQVVRSDMVGISVSPIANNTGMKIDYSGGGSGNYLELEYRIPVNGLLGEQYLSFGFDYSNVTQTGAVAPGIRCYKMVSGVLTATSLDAYPTNAAIQSGSTVIVRSAVIDSDVVAVGFIIRMTKTMATTLNITNPRAVYGKLYEIDSVPSFDPERLKALYQSGRHISTSKGLESDQIAASIPYVSKYDTLGELKARLSGSNRSSALQNIALYPAVNQMIASAIYSSSGMSRLDIEWECFVKLSLQ